MVTCSVCKESVPEEETTQTWSAVTIYECEKCWSTAGGEALS